MLILSLDRHISLTYDVHSVWSAVNIICRKHSKEKGVGQLGLQAWFNTPKSGPQSKALCGAVCTLSIVKGMEHVPNIFISFDKYLFLEVINILI